MSEQVDLDPESAQYRLVARIVAAAAEAIGRPTWWNGRIVIEPEPDDVGRAWPDGTLELQRDATLAPITAALAGTELDQTRLALVVNAFTTAVHEGAHLVHRDGDERAGHPVDTPDAIALNEGLIERWTHDHVDDVLHRAGVDRLVPQVIGQPLHDAYPAYTKATEALVEGVAAMTGRRPDEIEAELMVTERAQRWNKLVDVVVATGLGGAATDTERTRLVNAARMQFGLCQAIHQSTQYDGEAKQEHGSRVGRQTVSRILDEVAAINEDRADERAAELTAVDRDPNRFADFLSGHSTVIPGFARPAPTEPVPATSLPPAASATVGTATDGTATAGGAAGADGPVGVGVDGADGRAGAGAERRAPGAHAARAKDGDQGARSPVAARLGAMLRRSNRGIHRG